MVKISKFDAADYLKSPEAVAAYLTEALATDDAAYICTALDTIARAKGMSSKAKEPVERVCTNRSAARQNPSLIRCGR